MSGDGESNQHVADIGGVNSIGGPEVSGLGKHGPVEGGLQVDDGEVKFIAQAINSGLVIAQHCPEGIIMIGFRQEGGDQADLGLGVG